MKRIFLIGSRELLFQEVERELIRRLPEDDFWVGGSEIDFDPTNTKVDLFVIDTDPHGIPKNVIWNFIRKALKHHTVIIYGSAPKILDPSMIPDKFRCSEYFERHNGFIDEMVGWIKKHFANETS